MHGSPRNYSYNDQLNRDILASLKLQNNIDIVAENNEQGIECAINTLTTNTCYSQSNEQNTQIAKNNGSHIDRIPTSNNVHTKDNDFNQGVVIPQSQKELKMTKQKAPT